MMLPPLPAIGSVGIEIYGPAVGAAKWGTAVWGEDTGWAQYDWRDVTPQSMTCDLSWGADYPEGVLTVPATGQWSIRTYDPQRVLDPSNGASPYAVVLHPGNPIRVVYREGANTHIVRSGLIDEIRFNFDDKTGTLRGSDLMQLLARAQLPAGQDLDASMPATLQARAVYLINKVNLAAKIPVGAVASDPAVGKVENSEQSVLDHLIISARDAQWAFWLDADGTMQFRSYGEPVDNGIQLGGLLGIPIENVETDASLAGIYTSVTVYDTTAPTVAIKKSDIASQSLFGEISLLRERPIPAASVWADNLLADRAGASLQYTPGTLRIQTNEQLLSILQMGMVEIVTIAIESAIPPVNIPARALGAKIVADTTAGWSAQIVAYIPAKEWSDAAEPVPPEPEPPPVSQTVTRTYLATKDSRAARTSSNQNYGSGAENELPVGAWSGWRNRAFIDFATISWTDVLELVKAEMVLRTSTQVNIGFGSSPKIVCKRITEAWNEGNASSPSGGNALIYPGPSTTSTGSVTKAVPDNENVNVTVDVTAIVKAWAPVAIGGSGLTKRGIAIFSAGEDATKYTTEFKSRETANDPELRLTVKIPV